MKHQFTRENNYNLLKLQLINPMKIMPPPFNPKKVRFLVNDLLTGEPLIMIETELERRGQKPQTMKPKKV